ncbi:uncharacterized protein LOC127257684 [Andrographis paniculata]|uniref:uncharacterized protein LOC127257684 n=1 Tax=Andrographis paniculata TaxID=175694 RepID=UPI0021E7B5A8|nr:uncharacterized protein LOC127257684 [Andrographis paniculata]
MVVGHLGLIALDKDRLLSILLPQPALVLGAAHLTNTRGKVVTPGTGSCTPPRKRRASQTQAIPFPEENQRTLRDRSSGRSPVKTRPRPGPTLARATVQAASNPNKSPESPTDQLHELEPPTKRRAALQTPSPAELTTTGTLSNSEATASQMGRLPYVASDPSLPNMEPMATPASASASVASGVVASAAVSFAAVPPIDRDVSDTAIRIAPDEPAAAALDAADQRAADLRATDQRAADLRAADPPPEADRREEEPAVAQRSGLLQELQEIPSSDSETSVNLGPRSIPQRPFEAADESAIEIPVAHPSRPITVLAPSATTIRPEGCPDLAPLSAVPIPRDARTIIA